MMLTQKYFNIPRKMTWLPLIATTKYQRMNTATNEEKTKQINLQIKIHNEHLKNNTKIDKYKKTEQHYYNRTQSQNTNYTPVN